MKTSLLQIASYALAVTVLAGSEASAARAEEHVVLNGNFFLLADKDMPVKRLGTYDIWRDPAAPTGYSGRIRVLGKDGSEESVIAMTFRQRRRQSGDRSIR